MPQDRHSGTVLITPTACSSEAVFRQFSKLVKVHRWNKTSQISESISNQVVGIWVRQDTLVDQVLLDCFPNLKFVASTTTSKVHIDQDALQAREVVLLSLAPGDAELGLITSTVDHTWALILHVHGRVAQAHEQVRLGHWSIEGLTRKSQLSSMSLGVIGAGRIGFQVATIGKAFGMMVYVYDTSERVQVAAKAAGMGVLQSLEELFEASDYVSLNATSSTENFNMIGSRILEHSAGVNLFNTARGELVDEEAVISSLHKGQLYGYHSDVLVAENTANRLEDSPIYRGMHAGLPITLTPHVAGSSADAMAIAEAIILRKIQELGY